MSVSSACVMLCSYSLVQSHWAVHAVTLSAPWGQTHSHSAQKTVHQKSWPQLDPGFLQLLAEMRLSLFVLFLLWGNVDVSLSQNVISCGPPADVQFADVVLLRGNDYGLNSQVKYTCHQGYQKVRGSDIRRCTQRGWDGEAPVCKAATCQKPQLPNGFMVGPFDGKLYYTCNEDYKLLTEGWWGEAKCNSDELSELRCIGKTSCGPIPEIPNGEVTSQRRSYTDTEVVDVRCERGSFQQWPRLTCRQGEWQSNRGSLKETCKPPGISCSPPPKVENAVIMTSYQKEYFSDTEVTYQCRNTHTLMGGKTIKCNNGNWEKLGTTNENISCTPKRCDNPDDIDNGHYNITKGKDFVIGTQITYFCNEGYHMRSNDFTRTCTLDGWAGHVPECHPRSCGHPGDAQFADFQLEKGDDFVFGSQVVYTCHKGYQMVSRSNVRRCMVEGWDGVVPICEATQCPEIHVDNNVQVIGDVEEATYGNVVRFGCKSNAEILYGSQEIYCVENGEWSGQAPKCAEVKCSVPVIENGEVRGRITEYKEHETLHFVCNPKYKPTEDRPSKCTKLGQKAEFTPTPVCEQTKCKLQLLQGTRYEPHRNVFLPGETLRVICGNKHWIVDPQSNSAEFTCGDNGNWDNEPVCTEVTCRRPDDWQLRDGKVREFHGTNWPYWRQRFSLDDTASYSCVSGYRRTGGASQATCTRNGWTPNPLCEVISCGPPGDVQFADVVQLRGNDYGLNSQVKYTCHQGYQIVRGSFIRSCTESGWEGEAPVCGAPVECGRPPPLADGDIQGSLKSKYLHDERVEYTCQLYYVMEGGPHRTCSNGNWTGDLRCLKPCTVTDEAMRQRNIAFRYTGEKKVYSSHNDAIQFMCTGRTTHVGTVTMHPTCIDGEIQLPTCQ